MGGGRRPVLRLVLDGAVVAWLSSLRSPEPSAADGRWREALRCAGSPRPPPAAGSSPLIRGGVGPPPGSTAGPGTAGGEVRSQVRGRFPERIFSEPPGLTAGCPGTRRGGDPAGESPEGEGGRSDRVVTQKHGRSTLRSTSRGCYPVTRREDCGRVPSKRRCSEVRIVPFLGQRGSGLRILSPRFKRSGPRTPLSVHEPGGSRALTAREVSPRGKCYAGLVRRKGGCRTGPWPAAQRRHPSRDVFPSSDVLRCSHPSWRRADAV
jgi:hypothetical protein